MHCASCAALIKDVSSEFPEVSVADVDLASKVVTLTHADNFDLAQWKTAIEELGEEYAVHSPHSS